MAMNGQIRGSRGTLAGLVAVGVGVWAIVAPAVFGADEAAQWGWNTLLICIVPGAAAVLGGLGMLARRRIGAQLAFGGGVWLALASPMALLWAAGASGEALGADMGLLVWVAFFVQAGGAIALSAAHVLGYLQRLTPAPPAAPAGRARRLDDGAACESRRRRSNVNLGSRPLVRPQRAGRRPT